MIKKLEVGSGNKPREGYEHLDLDPNAPHVEYCTASWSICAEGDIFDEIYSRHFLEHLTPENASLTLKEWYRVLKDKGTVHVIVPNLEYHAKQLLRSGKSPFVKTSNFEHAMAAFFGWQGKGTNYFHCWGYTPKTLVDLFVKYNFKITTLVKCRACDIELKVHK